MKRDVRHVPVAVLTLDGDRTVRGDGGAHGAAQAAGQRPRMAAVAGTAVVAGVERKTG